MNLLNPLAGKPAPADLLIDVSKLESDYFARKPDSADPRQLVSFGTSGHRGTPSDNSFTESHVLAITQAICDYRKGKSISGPLFLGMDTHAISAAAQRTALEVLAANGVETFIQRDDGFTPTPSISHAILSHNRGRKDGFGDGIVLTPSHNPPEDGGLKYNPPTGGPADTDVTDWVQRHANELLRDGNKAVRRQTYESALRAPNTHKHDFISPYVITLGEVIDMEAISSAGIRIGVDPLGGASLPYWLPVKERYGLDLKVVNKEVDPRFGFMTVDHDGKIRMDCSSPYAMAGLVKLKDQFDIAFGCDPDADRHGIVTPSAGLLNPNHYLAVAIHYLLTKEPLPNRPQWLPFLQVGKTVVSSSLIDKVVEHLNGELCEVPVGFKWFTRHLLDCSFCFGGEESAGASFLRMDGTTWTTDKDGLILGLLAAEITARTHKDPGEHYAELTAQFGTPYYRRIDAPASLEQKAAFNKLTPEALTVRELAGEPIIARLTRAPGNHASIGGLKVVTESGWFAARPSGTENIYKLYAESFRSQAHLDNIIEEAQEIIRRSLIGR